MRLVGRRLVVVESKVRLAGWWVHANGVANKLLALAAVAELRAFRLILAIELRNTLQLIRLSSYRRMVLKAPLRFQRVAQSFALLPKQKGMSEIYDDVRIKQIKLDIVDLNGDFLACAKRGTLKEMNRCDAGVQNRDRFVRSPFVEFLCQDANIPISTAKIRGSPLSRPQNLRDSFLSGEHQFSRATPVDALRGNDERERLARLRATHPFALALSYILVAMSRPLNHAEACKESDMRRATFPARLFLRPFIKRHCLPPKAIYLIYCFFSMRRM